MIDSNCNTCNYLNNCETCDYSYDREWNNRMSNCPKNGPSCYPDKPNKWKLRRDYINKKYEPTKTCSLNNIAIRIDEVDSDSLRVEFFKFSMRYPYISQHSSWIFGEYKDHNKPMFNDLIQSIPSEWLEDNGFIREIEFLPCMHCGSTKAYQQGVHLIRCPKCKSTSPNLETWNSRVPI